LVLNFVWIFLGLHKLAGNKGHVNTFHTESFAVGGHGDWSNPRDFPKLIYRQGVEKLAQVPKSGNCRIVSGFSN
jgi:hypothetical protein